MWTAYILQVFSCMSIARKFHPITSRNLSPSITFQCALFLASKLAFCFLSIRSFFVNSVAMSCSSFDHPSASYHISPGIFHSHSVSTFFLVLAQQCRIIAVCSKTYDDDAMVCTSSCGKIASSEQIRKTHQTQCNLNITSPQFCRNWNIDRANGEKWSLFFGKSFWK